MQQRKSTNYKKEEKKQSTDYTDYADYRQLRKEEKKSANYTNIMRYNAAIAEKMIADNVWISEYPETARTR